MAAKQVNKPSADGVVFDVAHRNSGLYEETTTKWLIYVDSQGNVTELNKQNNLVRPFNRDITGTLWVRVANKGFCLEN